MAGFHTVCHPTSEFCCYKHAMSMVQRQLPASSICCLCFSGSIVDSTGAVQGLGAYTSTCLPSLASSSGVNSRFSDSHQRDQASPTPTGPLQ